jgi:hypothetical protein
VYVGDTISCINPTVKNDTVTHMSVIDNFEVNYKTFIYYRSRVLLVERKLPYVEGNFAVDVFLKEPKKDDLY